MWNNLKRFFLVDVWIILVLVFIISEVILRSLIFFNVIHTPYALSRVDASSYTWPSFITKNGIDYAKLRVSQRVRFLHRPTRRVVYDVQYTFNDLGFRASDPSPTSSSKDLLLLGDSFAFGWGLNYSDTLGSYLSQFGFETDNRALPGISLNDLEKQNPNRISIVKNLSPSIKRVIYVFNEAQLERVLMTYSSFLFNRSFVENKAFYELSQDEPIYKGTFKENRNFKNFFLGLSANFSFLYFLDPHLIGIYDRGDVKLFLKLLESVKQEIQEHTKVSRFYFVIYPKTHSTLVENFKTSNLLNNWKIIDLSNIPTDPANDFIDFDGHPNGLLNRRISEKIAEELRLVEKN